jgi:bacillithiol biosynthesis deacetylase BshB1
MEMISNRVFHEEYVCDVVAFAAHPDDVELAAGGAVAKLCKSGLNVAIVDFTAGEAGTRGTPEIRLAESMDSAKILGLKHRINLGMPDSQIAVTEENILKVIEAIRLFRPKMVLMNPPFDRHPDHEAAHKLVRKAMFKSGLRKIDTKYNGISQNPHRIRKMYAYMQSYEFPRKPDFYIDISDTFNTKMDSIKAYRSQIFVEGAENNEPQTRLSRPEFLEEIEARCIYFGAQCGYRYAEAFYSVEPVGLSGLDKLL